MTPFRRCFSLICVFVGFGRCWRSGVKRCWTCDEPSWCVFQVDDLRVHLRRSVE